MQVNVSIADLKSLILSTFSSNCLALSIAMRITYKRGCFLKYMFGILNAFDAQQLTPHNNEWQEKDKTIT